MLQEKIAKQLSECICVEKEDRDTIIGLPYPYSVPTEGNKFHELYYWDTYFTNLGLICSGALEQAKNNVDDMLYLVERYGFMPNGSRTFYLNRSQPPFLSIMVRDIFDVTQDETWLAGAYDTLKKEYDFWMNKRTFENGLAHYGYTPTDPSVEKYADSWVKRTGVTAEIDRMELAGNFIAQAESGWDFNARLGVRGQYYMSPDLNALLWSLENNMAYFASALNNDEVTGWRARAARRKQSIDTLLWRDREGFFADVDAETGVASPIFSAAAFYPMFVGIADIWQAERIREKLPLLERAHGVCPCAPHTSEGRFQWDAPNLWPCLQWIVYKALKNYGYNEDAERIAEKYVRLVESVERQTGQLCEKYYAESGDCDVTAEYAMPPMMGWTAGVYLKFLCR